MLRHCRIREKGDHFNTIKSDLPRCLLVIGLFDHHKKRRQLWVKALNRSMEFLAVQKRHNHLIAQDTAT